MPARPGAPTWLLLAYRIATSIYAPFAYRKITRKLRAQGVSDQRIQERLGNASLPRAQGPLIWFHAASVGESLSVLGLIAAMGTRLPGHEFLITTGTATSAELIAKRLPPRTRHQFAPLDAAGPVRRFYARWTPVAGVFVESELWPVMLMQGRARGVVLVLLNARLSQRSVKNWCKWPKTAAYVLDQFELMLTQNRAAADNLLAMGGDPARIKVGRNLKSTAAPLPVDHTLLASIQHDLGGRPFWVASSTHPGEEEVVLQAHHTLLQQFPDLCLLLIPRHPERGPNLARMILKSGFPLAMRSRGESLVPDTQIYLADTLGETGTWYALADFVFLGGSLKDIGGHNPFEPAISGAAVITGPYVRNFAETYAPLIARGGAVEIPDAEQLAVAVALWLTDKDAADTARKAAREYAVSQQDGLDHVVDQLCEALKLDALDA